MTSQRSNPTNTSLREKSLSTSANTSRNSHPSNERIAQNTFSAKSIEASSIWSGEKKARLAAFSAIQKKAENIRIMDLRGRSSFTDYFVICSGMTERQVRAIAEYIEAESKRYGIPLVSCEGLDEARWVLIDFGDLVVHVFIDAVRDFYDLEKLWAGAPRIDLPSEYYTGAIQEFPDKNLN